ncbi:MAG: DUF349 domain-containing protein [Bacteroidales bacterium]|nr:DUF349 domain-containing protein [Bacteroidales bacterium]
MEEMTPNNETLEQNLENTAATEPIEAAPVAETENNEAAPVEAAESEAPKAEEKSAEPQVDYSGYSREQLVEALRALLDEDITSIRSRVTDIRNRFSELTAAMQQQPVEQPAEQQPAAESEDEEPKAEEQQQEPVSDPVYDAFRSLYTRYRTLRQQHHDAMEAMKKKNLEAKQALIEEMRTLAESGEEQVKQAMDRFNDIQERWKAIGEVPREEMNNLWQSYHFQIEQFFNKLKINRELRALDQKKNLEKKIELCEKAEELIVEPSVTKAFKALQDLRARWKETGPVPAEQNEEIWQRFSAAANQIDQRRREYYDQRKEEMDNNLLAKQALIDKAVELTATQPQSTKEWNDLTAALDELLKVWKTIGPVPREVNEEIWAKFKGIIDRHYEAKKEHFGALRDEQNTNYQKKVELCLKAEAIAKREDWKKATEELLQLQKEWKETGATSRKVSDKIWQRFRAACDEFFAKKGEFFKERRTSEAENLAKKEAILAELKSHTFGDNRDENIEVIKEFQRRWAEAGYVPMADKERLHKEFRAEIDGIFERLKLSAREAEETAYRERLHNIGGDARKFVSNERQELTERIEKLRNDLSLWENNLGFLASSKQADLLKAEFEKKMQGARQQIALLHAKLRILNEAEKESEKKEE